MLTIYHNPRCSKSRATLALLEERGLKPKIVEYLKTPPSPATLKKILAALGKPPREIMRAGETRYKELKIADSGRTDADLIRLMIENPILIERPIVVNGDKAAVGRPPEAVLEIL